MTGGSADDCGNAAAFQADLYINTSLTLQRCEFFSIGLKQELAEVCIEVFVWQRLRSGNRVNQSELSLELNSEIRCGANQRYAFGLQVDGAENAVMFHQFGPVEIFGVGGGPNCAFGVMQHLCHNRTQQQPAKCAAALCRDHDQVHVVFFDVGADSSGRITVVDYVSILTVDFGGSKNLSSFSQTSLVIAGTSNIAG